MIQRRCMSNQHPSDQERWHDKRDPCPYCGDETSPHSKHLATAKLNNHLYASVEKQQKEVEFVKKVRTEKPPI